MVRATLISAQRAYERLKASSRWATMSTSQRQGNAEKFRRGKAAIQRELLGIDEEHPVVLRMFRTADRKQDGKVRAVGRLWPRCCRLATESSKGLSTGIWQRCGKGTSIEWIVLGLHVHLPSPEGLWSVQFVGSTPTA